ncbi:hypothetical protein P4119_31525 [Pseudomonas aeruginosa]|nr:hypothetical protein [Pseudomonas aeruginosa]
MNATQGIGWHGRAWISPGLGIFLGQAGSQDWHSHMAHQITVSLNGSLTVKCTSSSVTARAICIRAGVAHQIEADEVLSIYLDALSDEARALPDNIGEGITPIQMGDTASLRKLLSSSDPSAQQIREMVRLVLNLTTPPASDPRLQSVLAALKSRLMAGRRWPSAFICRLPDSHIGSSNRPVCRCAATGNGIAWS